jgi:hypothetical protein
MKEYRKERFQEHDRHLQLLSAPGARDEAEDQLEVSSIDTPLDVTQ